MSQQHTYAAIASDFALWNEFVNTDGAMTKDEFDAMTVDQKVALQVEAFGGLTIYIYDNETGKQVDAIQGRNNTECESRADDKWGSNDYTWDYINAARINVG